MGQIDCTHTDNRAICGLYHIEAFPTIKVVNNPITIGGKGRIIIQLHHRIHTNTILFGIGLTSKAIVNLLLSFFQKISILLIQLHCHINISNKCSIHPINILIWTPLPYSSRVHVLMLWLMATYKRDIRPHCHSQLDYNCDIYIMTTCDTFVFYPLCSSSILLLKTHTQKM